MIINLIKLVDKLREKIKILKDGIFEQKLAHERNKEMAKSAAKSAATIIGLGFALISSIVSPIGALIIVSSLIPLSH
ncbi:hypothetical protein [endosymbiont GvMRE of Glomus versiforme]|uniref:hypothetical protein n=1 Tax=endosymbiont GvMRE of Glomus versiforme TaxID=2039283 RepID=UPI000EDD11EC|nr:hypothetical protein [endosymbiont GvMRE of Glomus versiforme]RHZ35180.1 hypothetical protein GvMRE_IIg53 [endosymbiont GvMRE of Glomus versiforme]